MTGGLGLRTSETKVGLGSALKSSKEKSFTTPLVLAVRGSAAERRERVRKKQKRENTLYPDGKVQRLYLVRRGTYASFLRASWEGVNGISFQVGALAATLEPRLARS